MCSAWIEWFSSCDVWLDQVDSVKSLKNSHPRYNVLIKDPRTGAYKVNFAKDIFPAM